MTILLNTSDNIQPGDIVFACDKCSKSLAIDPRGAGVVVTCPDCGNQVQVPFLDETTVEDAVVQEGATADTAASALILDLQARLEELERRAASDKARFQRMGDELTLIQDHIDRVIATIMEVTSPPMVVDSSMDDQE